MEELNELPLLSAIETGLGLLFILGLAILLMILKDRSDD